MRRYFIKEWGNECVVFDAWSGDTHALDELSTYAFQRLQAGVCTVAEIASDAALAFSIDTDDEFLEALRSVLARLQAVGLADQLRS